MTYISKDGHWLMNCGAFAEGKIKHDTYERTEAKGKVMACPVTRQNPQGHLHAGHSFPYTTRVCGPSRMPELDAGVDRTNPSVKTAPGLSRFGKET